MKTSASTLNFKVIVTLIRCVLGLFRVIADVIIIVMQTAAPGRAPRERYTGFLERSEVSSAAAATHEDVKS